MRKIRKFRVVPSLPPTLEPLRELAYNLRWCWTHDAISLFHRLDRELWEAADHNPVLVLGTVKQERLDAMAANDGFLAHMNRVLEHLHEYRSGMTWFDKAYPDHTTRVAYFSAEFGLTECMPIYSGGLGILAGDHVKSSSELGIPLVGVGLLYRVGYLRQYLNLDGWQMELYPENDFYNMPIRLVNDDDGHALVVSVRVLERRVWAQIWCIDVGRVPIYMLDANLERNHPDDRTITAQLYGGDLEMRIRQEILLGIGGQRALQALGIETDVCHMNEGHSAFQALERVHRRMERHGLTFHEARQATAVGNVFTTHTPVPAGNDMFPPALVDKYMGHYWPRLGLGRDEFLGLGRIKPDDPHEPFCMTVLAIKLAAYSNGVSRLHGDVSRGMWQGIWPDVPRLEVPIGHITNGVHIQSWVARDLASLYDRYLGPGWRRLSSGTHARNGNGRGGNGATDAEEMGHLWARVYSIPDEELWRIHERLRARLVAFARERLRNQLKNRGAPQSEIEDAANVLDPEALTIAFARRFATYKRATLLFRDLDRLKAIIENRERPVQIIFAGKAHPRDTPGKELIRQIIHKARDPSLRRRVVFLEDYSMSVARRLVQGVDLWLNTPRRPMEASGTSGMKCAPNGGLNMSTPDGWWVEGYHHDHGWTIGKGEEYEDNALMDNVESQALYDLLEKDVIPLFYSRTENDLPKGWIAMMKSSIRSICPMFNTDRMVAEYTDRFYVRAGERSRQLATDNYQRARDLAAWQQRMEAMWSGLEVESVEAETDRDLVVNSALSVRALVRMGELSPDEVTVQLFHGPLDSKGNMQQAHHITMGDEETIEDGLHRYTGAIPCRTSGRHGFAVRVLPRHPDLVDPILPGLIRWG
jgi:starch phosphorylase